MTRFHELLGLPAETLDAVMPVLAAREPAPATGPVPWEKRQPPQGLGHLPTVRFWCWLTAVADSCERRILRERKARPAADTSPHLLKVRALRLTARPVGGAAAGGLWRGDRRDVERAVPRAR